MVDHDLEAERAVLGDELQQRGDPHGELIGLQLALAGLPATALPAKRSLIERRIAAHLDAHHDHFYGVLAPYVQRRSVPDVFDPALEVTAWLGGFADAIWLQTTHTEGSVGSVPRWQLRPATRGEAPQLDEVYRRMRTLSIARFVRRLVVGSGDEPAVVAAISADPPPALRSLVFGDSRCWRPMLHQVHLAEPSPLLALMPRIEELRIPYCTFSGPFDSPTLRVFAADARHHYPAAHYLRGELPALADVTLRGFAIDPSFCDRFPALRSADLRACRFDAGWLEHFLVSQGDGRCLQLNCTSADLAVILRHVRRVERLERLELHASGLSADELSNAGSRLPANVVIHP